MIIIIIIIVIIIIIIIIMIIIIIIIIITIPVDLKSTQFSLERVNLTKKNSFELKNISFQ